MTDRANKPWSATELAYLRSHYGQKPTKRIAAHLNRSKAAVYVAASKFGVVFTARDDIERNNTAAWGLILGIQPQNFNVFVRRGELILDEDSKDRYFRFRIISEVCIERWLRQGGALRCAPNARTPKYWCDIIAEVKAQYISSKELRAIDGIPHPFALNGKVKGMGKAPLVGIYIGVGKDRDVYYRKADIYEAIYSIGHVLPRTIKDPYIKAIVMAWDSVYVATWQLMPYYRPRKERTHPESVIYGVYNRGEIVAWLRQRGKHRLANILRQDPITWQELHADIDRRKRLGQPL